MGDSGSIVYREKISPGREEPMHRPLGMFIGESADSHLYEYIYPNKKIYQAVFLQEVFKDIEIHYKDEIKNIQPFTTY